VHVIGHDHVAPDKDPKGLGSMGILLQRFVNCGVGKRRAAVVCANRQEKDGAGSINPLKATQTHGPILPTLSCFCSGGVPTAGLIIKKAAGEDTGATARTGYNVSLGMLAMVDRSTPQEQT